MTRKIDKQTGEIITIKAGGLYSPLPIPAYRALGLAGEFKAQQLLMCLVAHLGSNGNKVWPTYEQITDLCGLHKSYIRGAIDVLEEFGFIKVLRSHTGKHIKNVYFIHNSCYDSSKFNHLAKKYTIKKYVCSRCAKTLSAGEFKTGPQGEIHLGCGGNIQPLAKIKYATAM